MKVKCIKSDGNFFINFGEVYEAEWHGCDRFRVDTGNNSSGFYPKDLFEIVPETKKVGMMKVTLDLPEMEGFEYTGEYRSPKKGEWFLDGIGKPCQYQTNNLEGRPPFPILKKKAPKYITLDHLLPNKKFVEIKAFEDAMRLLCNCWHGEDEEIFNALKKLVK